MSYMWVMMVVAAFVVSAGAADPLQDFCVADNSAKLTLNGRACKPASEVTEHDFVFRGLKNAGDTNNREKIALTSAAVMQFPALNTLGISAARVDYAKGAVNIPHFHPRASEVLFLLHGEVYAGFVTTNNTLFSTVLKSGEMIVFPRGLIHFQVNVGKGSALAFAAFSSEAPGRVEIGRALFTPENIKDEILLKGFRIHDQKTVDMIQAEFRTA